ncbi:MAG: hypothetical protein ACR2PB_03405 [Desulfocapsaceae bacterium]
MVDLIAYGDQPIFWIECLEEVFLPKNEIAGLTAAPLQLNFINAPEKLVDYDMVTFRLSYVACSITRYQIYTNITNF